jgi:hypothetical protein
MAALISVWLFLHQLLTVRGAAAARNFNCFHTLNGCLTHSTFSVRTIRRAFPCGVKLSEGNHLHLFVSKVKNEGIIQLLLIPCYDLRRKDFAEFTSLLYLTGDTGAQDLLSVTKYY